MENDPQWRLTPSSPVMHRLCRQRNSLHSIARQPLSYNTDTGAGLYASILAHVSVSNPVTVGSTIYVCTHISSRERFQSCSRRFYYLCLYAGILAHVSVSNPVPVGSTIYEYIQCVIVEVCNY